MSYPWPKSPTAHQIAPPGWTEQPLTVGAFVPYAADTTPSQRFRIEQWMPYLAAQGIQVELLPFADARLMRLMYQPGRWAAKAAGIGGAFWRSARRVASARQYDAVLIHRAVSIAAPAVLERVLACLGRPVIFDFDDAIYALHISEGNRAFGWLKCPGKTAAICRLSHHVVVGNAYLAAYARRHAPRVSVIPTSVDTEHYAPATRRPPNDKVIIGWTGSATSQTHLEAFTDVLARLVQIPGVELRIVSNRRPELPGIEHAWRPWSPATEVGEIAQFDIGIMPMPDDVWAKGKCALKALQYMALGIPAVCSAVGTNCEVIEHGRNGMLASTAVEWLAHLEALIHSASHRRRLGRAARRTVEARYSMRRSADLFATVVRDTVSSLRGSDRNISSCRVRGNTPPSPEEST